MICPSCGKENYGDAGRCYNCGTDFNAYQQGPEYQQFRQGPMAPPGMEKKKGIPTWGIVLIVVGSILFLGVIILVAAGVLYTWSMGLADTESSDISIMSFEVRDGVNRDVEHGCFFTIRAKRGVEIDPTVYSFYVSKKGEPLQKLDFRERSYVTEPPSGGDRNSSFDWTENGILWTDGEYIGFDMPMTTMGIDIEKGAVYEVMIKDPAMRVVYEGDFVYQVSQPLSV